MRVVIDTNLLIDGVKDDFNYGNRVIDLVLAGKIQAFANRATLRENKLIAGKKVKDLDYSEKLEKYFEKVQVTNSYGLDSIDVVEDKEDNKLVESAVASGADYLISSDKHLLKLESYKGVKMVRPQEFVNLYEEESGSGWNQWIGDFIK